MELKIAALADSANLSEDGKLNMLGVFDRVVCRNFPTVLPDMVVVVRLVLEYTDGMKRHQLTVRLLDEDGNLIAQFEDEFDIAKLEPGDSSSLSQLMILRQIQVQASQNLRFEILLDGQRSTVLDLLIIDGRPSRDDTDQLQG